MWSYGLFSHYINIVFTVQSFCTAKESLRYWPIRLIVDIRIFLGLLNQRVLFKDTFFTTVCYRICYACPFHSVHWGINPPPQKHPPPSSQSPPPPAPLNLQNVQAPLLGSSRLYIVFFLNPPSCPKNPIFQWTLKTFKFFILNPILSFKNNKILSKSFSVWILCYDREKHFFL